uniref:Uncharacterized protein n=1 Tax=Paramoeba aestuarina TaxID=180227 RepID=A0A7S4N6Y1_9EUKA|mmetsp:Transcript_11790/g.17885  ORF Transcript_11790/g.17885 Transcript_11790/m.17885 type:complete len:221 (+) Transcript_11790:165-827(+)
MDSIEPMWVYRQVQEEEPPLFPPSPPSLSLPRSPFPSPAEPANIANFRSGSFLSYPPLDSFDRDNIHFTFQRGFFNTNTSILKITPHLVVMYVKYPRFLGLEDREFSARFPRKAVRSVDWETPNLEITDWLFWAFVLLLALIVILWLFDAGEWVQWGVLGGYSIVFASTVALFCWYYAKSYVLLRFRLDNSEQVLTYEVELKVEEAQVVLQAFFPLEPGE